MEEMKKKFPFHSVREYETNAKYLEDQWQELIASRRF
jgi:hypothetical protein